jgi:hypothetical protein
MCVNFNYECHYRLVPRRRRGNSGKAEASDRKHSTDKTGDTISTPEQLAPDSNGDDANDGHFASTLESNSGSAFVRKFAMNVDPSNVPTSQMLGWNIFLGERQTPLSRIPESITSLLSFEAMRDLSNIYFTKVDPCYGFVDRSNIDQAIVRRWLPNADTSYDAILCGLAAVGCLYSTLQDRETESGLIILAKTRLDIASSEPPSLNNATGWVLRTVYLRMAAKLDEAWMSSCTALHAIDAAGLHCEPDANVSFRHSTEEVSAETRRRIFGVARHLNIWLSFDLGRSRVILQNVSTVPPAPRPGDYTTELLGLLPYSEALDPGKTPSTNQLLSTFSEVLGRSHSQPPSILAQSNLILCLYRRLYTLKTKIPEPMLEKAVLLIQRALAAACSLVETGSPWHHVANIPFQCVCTLLAIDTVQSFSVLAEATACLETVLQRWRTRSTEDGSSAARALIHIHRKRREADTKRQSELLQLYPSEWPISDGSFDDFSLGQAFDEIPWFNELIPDMDFGMFESPLSMT